MFKLFKRKKKMAQSLYYPGDQVKFTPVKQGRRLLRKIQKDGHG